jgi:hypothetical protein
MTPAVSKITEQVRFAGIRPKTESGAPAKVYQDDQPLVVTTTTGDAVGSIENFVEDAGDGGSSFDVVLKPTTANSASVLLLKADADADSGEVREITEEFNYSVLADEAVGFTMPGATVEPLVP